MYSLGCIACAGNYDLLWVFLKGLLYRGLALFTFNFAMVMAAILEIGLNKQFSTIMLFQMQDDTHFFLVTALKHIQLQ